MSASAPLKSSLPETQRITRSALRIYAGNFSFCQGRKSFSPQMSMSRAVGELLERYSLSVYRRDIDSSGEDVLPNPCRPSVRPSVSVASRRGESLTEKFFGTSLRMDGNENRAESVTPCAWRYLTSKFQLSGVPSVTSTASLRECIFAPSCAMRTSIRSSHESGDLKREHGFSASSRTSFSRRSARENGTKGIRISSLSCFGGIRIAVYPVRYVSSCMHRIRNFLSHGYSNSLRRSRARCPPPVLTLFNKMGTMRAMGLRIPHLQKRRSHHVTQESVDRCRCDDDRIGDVRLRPGQRRGATALQVV